MTFTEAAIEVLRREGKPLHFKKIAEIAIREGLLDHVGKIPEEVMGGQLAAHCRLPHAERRILAVQPATFALVEWGLDEDSSALDNLLERPAENEPPLRSNERHPVPSREVARGFTRGEPRVRRREEGEERQGRRFPPPAEVAYEILAGADRPISLSELGALGAERFLMPDAFVRDTSSLAAALREDNRRREASGRRPLFEIEGDSISLVAQSEPGERPTPPMAVRAAPADPADARCVAIGTLRRRIRDCSSAAVEYLSARLLERMGLRDVKVAKRGREQVVFTGRKRIGLVDVRHCVRVIRSGADVGRREVQEVRRDLGHYGAQVGILLTPGDALREARGESLASSQLPVFLLCGDALAEVFIETSLGCQPVVIPVIDEGFFRQAIVTAEKEEAARRARREERERYGRTATSMVGAMPLSTEEGRAAETAPALEMPSESRSPLVPGVPSELPGTPALVVADEDADEEEGEEEAGSVPGEVTPSPQLEGERRRRRRRRRRGGRGRSRERTTPGSVVPPASAGPVESTTSTGPISAPAVPSAVETVSQLPMNNDEGNAG